MPRPGGAGRLHGRFRRGAERGRLAEPAYGSRPRDGRRRRLPELPCGSWRRGRHLLHVPPHADDRGCATMPSPSPEAYKDFLTEEFRAAIRPRPPKLRRPRKAGAASRGIGPGRGDCHDRSDYRESPRPVGWHGGGGCYLGRGRLHRAGGPGGGGPRLGQPFNARNKQYGFLVKPRTARTAASALMPAASTARPRRASVTARSRPTEEGRRR